MIRAKICILMQIINHIAPVANHIMPNHQSFTVLVGSRTTGVNLAKVAKADAVIVFGME